MIFITSLLALSIYNNIINTNKINSNIFNLFHRENSFIALLLFSCEGIFYLLTAYFRRDKKCDNLRDILIFIGISSITSSFHNVKLTKQTFQSIKLCSQSKNQISAQNQQLYKTYISLKTQ